MWAVSSYLLAGWLWHPDLRTLEDKDSLMPLKAIRGSRPGGRSHCTIAALPAPPRFSYVFLDFPLVLL